MKKELFSIGEVSKIKGVTIKALRFYEKIGLLKPHEVNPTNQYRYYHISQFIFLDIIKASRALEISPNALIPYFQSKDTQGVLHLLSKHKQLARLKMERLDEAMRSIEHFESSLSHAQSSDCRGEIQMRSLAERHIFVMPYVQDKDIGDYLIDYSKLDDAVSQQGLMNLYDEGVLFAPNDNGEFAPAYIFTTVSKTASSEYCQCIPAGQFLCVCYSEETAQEQTEKIIRYIVENELEPTHILQVELITDLFEPLSTLFEFQVRIDA
ncbi:MAG: MerR family DNA-binding transcriptional regulator [Clostridiaceae bacterium]|nr:MerR family DNA-binding transcriptional regulator [Clostridiaceae bacterium]